MDEQIALAFLAGVVIQAVFCLRKKIFSRQSIVCISVAGITFLLSMNRGVGLYRNIMFSSLCLVMLMAVFFRNELIKSINESVILQLNIVFIYALVLLHGFSLYLSLALIPTIIVLFFSFSDRTTGFGWKLFMQVWFLLINVLLILFYFGGEILNSINSNGGVSESSISSIFLGMISFQIVINIMYVYLLIPLPGENRGFRGAWEDSKEHARILTEKYSDFNLGKKGALIIILFFSLIIGVNYFLKILSDHDMISILLLLIFDISLLKKKDI